MWLLIERTPYQSKHNLKLRRIQFIFNTRKVIKDTLIWQLANIKKAAASMPTIKKMTSVSTLEKYIFYCIKRDILLLQLAKDQKGYLMANEIKGDSITHFHYYHAMIIDNFK